MPNSRAKGARVCKCGGTEFYGSDSMCKACRKACRRKQYWTALGKEVPPLRVKAPPCSCCGLDVGRCKKKHAARSLERYHASPELRAKQAERQKTPRYVEMKRAALDRRNPARRLLSGAKARAASRGLECSISVADIQAGDTCPCCGATLARSRKRLGKGSPSLDRIDNAKGYVPGNVWVICARCNMIKGDATPAELRQIADAVERRLGIGFEEERPER